MQTRHGFTVVLFMTFAVALCPARGEDIVFPEEYASPVPVMADPVDRVFSAPDPSLHAGLLGKIYLQQRYVHQRIDDPDIRPIDKSIQGFNSVLNLPVATLDLPLPLDFDVFMGYSNVGIKGSTVTGPPLDLGVSLNGKSENFYVGTTIYPTLAEKWRPFVQVGAEFSRGDVDFVIRGPNDTFADNVVDNDTSLLLNAGFEFDLLDYLGYRITFDIETKDRLQDSVMSNDLILWPHDHIFLRGGMATSLDGNGLGFSVGGGLAF